MTELPPHGAPCNRCGVCCQRTLCVIAMSAFEKKLGPCPAIEIDNDGLPACGLVEHPRRYVPRQVKKFGIAAVVESVKLVNFWELGCDFRAGRPLNLQFAWKIHDTQLVNYEKWEQVRNMWGLPIATGPLVPRPPNRI